MVMYEKNEQLKSTNKLLELKVNLAMSLYTKSVQKNQLYFYLP